MVEVNLFKIGMSKNSLYTESRNKGAKQLFEFFADNTNVEFSLTNFTDGRGIESILSTDHNTGKVGVNTNLLDQKKEAGIFPYEDIHSHPDDDGFTFYPEPSGFDENGNTLNIVDTDATAARIYESYNSKIVQQIYVPRFKLYVKYNSQKILK